MRTTRFIVALLLVLAAWQSSHAQGFRVYLNDGTFRQYSLRTDSIVFFDGAGEEVDYNPFAPDNASILGSWYDADGNELYFRKDGTTNYTGGHYKFMPYVGSLVISDANGHPTRVIRVADLTKDTLLLSSGSASSFNLLTRQKPEVSDPTPTSITCAEAVTLVNAMTDGATSTETYTITGYITEVLGSVSRNQQSFWMADTKDGGKVFEAYWANLPEGIEAFTLGMKVTITGQLMKYVKGETVTPEIKNATVVILEQGGGNNDGGDGGVVNGLQNGSFEAWVSDNEPKGWKSACTASNATLSKSTNARTGSFSCCVGHSETANKRLASQEMTLAAGTYKLSYYAKSTTADPSQTRGGHVTIKDGAIGAYVYDPTYTSLNNGTWTLVEYEFTLSEETTVCLIIMNPKNSSYNTSQDILVDDITLEKQ